MPRKSKVYSISVLAGQAPHAGKAAAPASPAPLFAHPGGCRQCHPVENGLVAGPAAPGTCLAAGCHDRIPTQRSLPHGPVALGACTICHEPHTSSKPRLLAAAEAKLCRGCHEPLWTCPSLQPDGSTAPCSACHDSHGGEKAFLLR